MHRIEFFYDIVSPYSFFAFEGLCRYRVRWQLDLVLRPCFLGGIFKSTGNAAPLCLPARAPYVVRDLERSAAYYELPLRMPEGFPGNTLPCMRMLVAAQDAAPDAMESLTRALWRRYWVRGEDISSEAGLRAACEAAELSDTLARELVARIAVPEVKERLKACTAEAVERGAFGLPSYFLEVEGGEEHFFGADRIPYLGHALGQPWEGPCPSAPVAASS